MNPNSQHQLWSRWDVTVTPPTRWTVLPPTLGITPDLWARFVRNMFGTTAGEVRLEERGGGMFSRRPWQIFAQARLEGVPAHDPAYRAYMERRLADLWIGCFRSQGTTTVEIDVHIEAGDRQDGAPPAQLIMLPTLTPEAPLALVPMP